MYNIIRRLFGLPDNQENVYKSESEPRNEFRKPIWNMGDDDEEDDDRFNYRPQAPFGFKVFSNPVEIHRFFEHQMNEMLKMFQSLNQPSIFTQDELGLDDDGSTFKPGGFSFGLPSLPAPFTPGGSNADENEHGVDRPLRNYYLKPGYDMRRGQQANQDRKDSDLDDKINSGELSTILDNFPSSSDSQPDEHQRSGWYRSVITFSTTRPDGTVEERKTVDNGNGKEETVTRRIGDQTYSVTTATDSNGLQTRTERLINMDKDGVNDFEKNWHDKNAPGVFNPSNPSVWFPFDKLFK